MLTRGSDNLTRQQLSDELDKYRAQMNASGEPGVLTLSIRTRRENLLSVLGLMEEVLRHPAFVPEELELLKEEQLAGLSQRLTDPTAIASTIIQRRISSYPPDDPRYVPTIEEEIARVRAATIDDVRTLYGELLGASVGELTIVGDFDPEPVQAAVDRITSGWKLPASFAAWHASR